MFGTSKTHYELYFIVSDDILKQAYTMQYMYLC